MEKFSFDPEETAIIHAIGQSIAEFHEERIKEAIISHRNGIIKPALRVDQSLRVMGLEGASLLFQTLYIGR